jgi:Yip1-like protein
VASPAIQNPEAPEGANSIGRIFGVLFSPKVTFDSIARRPTWILPVIILCIVELSIIGVFSRRVGWRDLIEKQLAGNSRFQQLTPAQQETQIQVALKVAPIVAYVPAVVGPFLVALAFAGILWLIFNMAVGAKFGFQTSLAVVSYCQVPSILTGLVGILILFLKDPSTVDLQHLVASNAGAFLSGDSPKWLSALLGSVDLFLFWEMILLAMGFNAVAPKKISVGGAFAWILGLWVFGVMIRVGIAAAFS